MTLEEGLFVARWSELPLSRKGLGNNAKPGDVNDEMEVVERSGFVERKQTDQKRVTR